MNCGATSPPWMHVIFVGKAMVVWLNGDAWWLFEYLYLSKGWKEDHPCPLSPSQLHKIKPQKNREHSDLLLTTKELFLKVSHHEFKDNLRANSPQQGEDDGGPSPTMSQGHQGSPTSPSLMSKIQEISLGEQGNYFVKTRISAVHKPGFVHVIT